MGTYKEYLRNRKLAELGSTESIEIRVDASMSADEAFRAARIRLERFIAEYTEITEPQTQLAAAWREQGYKESIIARIEHEVQQIATMERKKNGQQTALLLDDLLIILHLMTAELQARGSHNA